MPMLTDCDKNSGISACLSHRRYAMRNEIRLVVLFSWFLAVVAFSHLPAGPAIAADAEPPLAALDFKMAGDASRVRIVVHFDRKPVFSHFLLSGPDRLVVNLQETVFAFDADSAKPRGLVSDVRYGLFNEGRSRLIVTANAPFLVEKLEVLENKSLGGFRLVADLKVSTREQFEQTLRQQDPSTGTTRTTRKTDRLGGSQDAAEKPFTIVIDPGHGGIDGGARGVSGTMEKSITLSFGKELKKSLEQSGKYRVFLTREEDTFLRLDERVRLARQFGADLFLSIHADTIRLRGIRGATVYTISEKASDHVSKAIAERENLSDAVAGVELEDEQQEVADILIDLARRETQLFSIRFARRLIDEMSGEIELINNPHRSAGFRVLRAPDVPSVLVELGYLSNPKDEAQMRDPDWRRKAVRSITSAVLLFAQARELERG